MIDGSERWGPPDLAVGPFSLWAPRRSYPELVKGWDAAWILINANVETPFARVEVWDAGPTSMDFAAFLPQLLELERTLEGRALLKGLEPELSLELHGASLGHIEVRVEITPDHLTQRHRFDLTIDQTFLPAIIRQAEVLVARYPIPDVRKED